MGIKDWLLKTGCDIKKGANFIGDKVKKGYDKVKTKIDFSKMEKEKQKYLINQFENSINTKDFKVFYKNGKNKDIKCIYDLENKILKTNIEIDALTIDYFEDTKHQRYFIENIDLNGDCFTCDYNGEILTLPLEKFLFIAKEPIKPVNNTIVNNYVDNSQTQNIKAKDSILGGTNNKIEKETKVDVGIHGHLHN